MLRLHQTDTDRHRVHTPPGAARPLRRPKRSSGAAWWRCAGSAASPVPRRRPRTARTRLDRMTPPLRNHCHSQFPNGIVSSVSFVSTTHTASSLALRLAGIGADAVPVAGQLGEALSGLVGRHRSVVDLTADRPLEHGRVDEGGFGMRVTGRVAARAVFDEHAWRSCGTNALGVSSRGLPHSRPCPRWKGPVKGGGHGAHGAEHYSFTGVRMGAPLPFSSTTTNLAGSVVLALRPTT
jgi:hypothetical protein